MSPPFGSFPPVKLANDITLDYQDRDEFSEQQVNTRWGGRGVYFPDPSGHNMEILTRVPS